MPLNEVDLYFPMGKGAEKVERKEIPEGWEFSGEWQSCKGKMDFAKMGISVLAFDGRVYGVDGAYTETEWNGQRIPILVKKGTMATQNKNRKITVPQCWKDAEEVLKHSRLTLLYGPPGTGKTHAAMKYANDDFENTKAITLHEETSADELRGYYVPKDGGFEWQDGPAIAAWRNGNRIVLNELDHASGDALSLCLAILDDPDIAALTLPTGETVRPHKNFSAVATINGEPSELPPALRDRFTVAVEINKPHPDAIRALPESLHNIAYTQTSLDRGTRGERQQSVRSWKIYGELRTKMKDEQAARIVFGDEGKDISDAVLLSEVPA